MTYDRTTPSQTQLFAAYKAGVDLNEYIRMKKIFKSHVASIAVVQSHVDPNCILRRIEDGLTIEEIVDIYDSGVSFEDYFDTRGWIQNSEISISHAETLAAISMGLKGVYKSLLRYGVSREEITTFSTESFDMTGSAFCYYIARSRGFSIEESRDLAAHPFHPADMVPKMLDIGVTVTEMIEAATLDGDESNLIINNRMRYYFLRHIDNSEGAHMNHAKAMEAVMNNRRSKYPGARSSKRLTRGRTMKTTMPL